MEISSLMRLSEYAQPNINYYGSAVLTMNHKLMKTVLPHFHRLLSSN